jgi:hypothetical protein
MAKSREQPLVRSMRHEMNRLRHEVKLGQDELENHRGKVERTRGRERRSSLGNPSGRAAAVACLGKKARLSEPVETRFWRGCHGRVQAVRAQVHERGAPMRLSAQAT